MREGAPKPIVGLGPIPEEARELYYEAKFVILRTASGYALHMGRDYNSMSHRVVARFAGVKLEDLENQEIILGGGRIRRKEGKLILDDCSGEYKGVPKEILELFRDTLLHEMKVSEVIFNPSADDKDRQRFGFPPRQN